MDFRTLSNTDLRISRLAFGCWGITSDNHWGQRNAADSIAAIDEALEAGINFFDTAEMYANGQSETLLGEAMKGRRDRFVVASKMRFDAMAKEELIESCESSLRRLQTDYLDLYQIHWPHPEVPLADTWGTMLDLKAAGKVREIGVCNFGVRDLSSVNAIERPVTNQLPYNLIWRAIESHILPTCIEAEVDTLVYSPLMHGLLADKYPTAADVPDGRARSRHFSSSREQTRHGEAGHEPLTFATLDRIREVVSSYGISMASASLGWLLSKPGVGSVIAGAKNGPQVQGNVKVFDELAKLGQGRSAEMIQSLDEATDELKSALGSNPDMWQGREACRFH